MKKVLVLVTILISSLVFGQIRFGGSAALNATNIVDQHSFSNSRLGFSLGAFALIPLDGGGDQFYLQPGIYYSQQGENNEPNGSAREEYYLDYINIPILAKIYFNENYNQFFGEIGPTFGILVNENIDAPAGAEGINNEYNGFDFALTLGIGYSFDRKFEAFIRYNYGFSDIVTNRIIVNNVERDIKNRSSNLNFGISYILQ